MEETDLQIAAIAVGKYREVVRNYSDNFIFNIQRINQLKLIIDSMHLDNKKLTLNKNFILRKSNREYSIYNINRDVKTVINQYLYTILRIFEQNSISFLEIESFLQKKRIPNDLSSVKQIINEYDEFCDLLVASDTPNRSEDLYKLIKTSPKQFYEFTPESIDLLITNKCNLKCPHCYRNSTAKDKLNKIDLDRLYKLFDEMEELKIRSFKITGGEPFLCPELFDIISHASNKYIYVSILTNATIALNEQWLNLLAKKNIFLGISLDGATSLTHDIIRGEGAFEKTVKNLHNFTKYKIRYSLTFTVNNVNKNELYSIVNLVRNEFKNKRLTFNFVEKSGRAKDNDDIFSMSREEINTIKEIINTIILENSDFNIKMVDNNALETKEEDLALIKEKGDLIFCKAGHSILAIDSQLNVYPCIYGIGGVKEYPIANLKDDNLINIWNNAEKLDTFRGKLKIQDLPVCRSCKFQTQCNLKHCRLRSIYEGNKFTDPTSFCAKMISQTL